MKRYLKTTFILILINTIVFAQEVISPWEMQDPEIYQLEQKIDKLEKVSASLYQLHEKLTTNSKAVLELNKKAADNLRNNIYKIYLKGSLDIYNKVASPLGSMLDLANEVFMNLAVEPALWKTDNQRVFINRLNEASYFRNTKLRLMFVTLSMLMSYDCARFDDDLQPITYTKSWWGNPDGKPDDETEMVTRKTNLIVNLSDMVYKKTEEELNKIREERRETTALIDNSKKELSELKIKDTERRKKLKETDEWVRRMRERAGISSDVNKTELQQNTPNDPPEVKQKLSEVRNELNINREDEKSKREELERLKKAQMQKEADARVYIDSDCSRHVLANERVPMIIRISPEDIKGTFVLYVDEKEVGRTKKESNSAELGYLFNAPGKYDIQVKLLTRGNYNDTYTDQFYVEENPTIKIPGVSGLNINTDGPAYDSKLEGTKKLKLDLGFCKYYVLYEGGKIYLTGYYYTPTQQKVEYRSEPLAPSIEPFAEKGLMITKSGTGYHFYQTVSVSNNTSPYIVTRMRGTEVKIINRFNANWMQVKPASDLSTITIEYKETKDGAVKSIILD